MQFLTTTSEGYISLFFTLALMLVLLYFMIYRPQKKQEKKDAAMRSSLEIGDQVTTIGGVIGRVVASSQTSICRKAPSSCWCRPCTATKRPWQLIRLPFRNVTDFSLLATPWPSCDFMTVLRCIFAKRDEIFCG